LLDHRLAHGHLSFHPRETVMVSDIDRLEVAMAECRELIREAHGATKDLRAALREAKDEVQSLARDEVAGRVETEVARQLEDLNRRTGDAITAATDKVIAEFDSFGETLLGKTTYWEKVSGRRAAKRPERDVVAIETPEGGAPS
jgi:hypothetical protein